MMVSFCWESPEATSEADRRGVFEYRYGELITVNIERVAGTKWGLSTCANIREDVDGDNIGVGARIIKVSGPSAELPLGSLIVRLNGRDVRSLLHEEEVLHHNVEDDEAEETVTTESITGLIDDKSVLKLKLQVQLSNQAQLAEAGKYRGKTLLEEQSRFQGVVFTHSNFAGTEVALTFN
jgi:hypothetical protein